MPIYEFRCSKCGNIFEKLFISARENVDLKCPKCNSEEFERVMSATNYAMSSGRGSQKSKVTTKSCSPGNSCSTIELPGPE